MTCLNPDDLIGKPLAEVDTPSLLLEAGALEANIQRLGAYFANRPSGLRPHFKSHKCTRIAKMQMAAGAVGITCAKLGEAEAVADAGIREILVANQIVGPIKIARLVRLARRSAPIVAVDCLDNAEMLSEAAASGGVKIGVLIEVDIGMNRCGVAPGEAAVKLARKIKDTPGLRFVGLQGYDGHLQLLPDPAERRAKCLEGLERLIGTRRLIESAGIPVEVVTGGGTGTWEFVSSFPGMTEIQPGSFVLMDCAYHAVRPEFGCSLSILTAVISSKPGQYVLDAGSKAISKDFGTPVIKDHPAEQVLKQSEEHTRVQADGSEVGIGARREVIPAHCCATMNLHRTAIAVRRGKVEAVWPIEASGRYD